MKATLIRVDGSTAVSELKTKPADYNAIAKIVRPLLNMGPKDYFEHVTVWHGGKRTDMFVDEIGHQKRLERNNVATEIYRAATMAGMTGMEIPEDPDTLHWIAGEAVLFDDRVWY